MKVENYGDLFAKVLKKPLLAYETFGSYQGDYIVVLDAGDSLEVYKGSYGSCSGCDWLEAEQDYSTDEVSDEEAKKYVDSDKPFAVIPKNVAERVDAETLEQMLPKNSRLERYDDITYTDICKTLKEAAAK